MKELLYRISYETIFIIASNFINDEDSLLKIVKRYQNILTINNAKNVVTKILGKKILKYAINGVKEGVYVQLNYEANGDLIALVERTMTIDAEILRYLTLRTP